MSMTDRELLKKAAKAAGIKLCWSSGMPDVSPRRADSWLTWNPLADDGDALRLQSRLGLDVQYSPEAVEVVAHQHARMEGREAVAPWAWEMLLNETDPCAATRRAIVRAAAAIADQA